MIKFAKCSGKEKGPEGPFLDIHFGISLRGSVTPAGVQDLDYSRQLVRIRTRSRTVFVHLWYQQFTVPSNGVPTRTKEALIKR